MSSRAGPGSLEDERPHRPGQDTQDQGQDEGGPHGGGGALPAQFPAHGGDGGGAGDVKQHEDGEGEELGQGERRW